MRTFPRVLTVAVALTLLAGCSSVGAQEQDGAVAVRSSVVTARLALTQYLHGRSTAPATDTVFSDVLTQIGDERQSLAELTASTAAQRHSLDDRRDAIDRATRTVQDIRSRLGSGVADADDVKRLRDAAKQVSGS